MGKVISIVGNLGSGKTTLAKLLCDRGEYVMHKERPAERPFHVEYGTHPHRWALANQMDFFLYRSEQEANARQRNEIALFDGGFDQDFHVFTRHIYNRGYLTQAEFNICARFYRQMREFLPPSDLMIRLVVDIPTLLKRRALRGRKTDNHLFGEQELVDFEQLIDNWCEELGPLKVMGFPFDQDFYTYTNEVDELIIQISKSPGMRSSD